MSSGSKASKALLYYLVRKRCFGQLSRLCDSLLSNKKERGSGNGSQAQAGSASVSVSVSATVAGFWRAFAAGMCGDFADCMRQMEALQARRDAQLAAVMAMLYFHRRQPKPDREAVENLRSELSATRDVSVSVSITVYLYLYLY